MFREERIRIIMELLKTEQKVYVKSLAKHFDRSESSIRLDLAELEKRGLIIRTHGGAMIADGAADKFELRKSVLSSRDNLYKEEKQRIGLATIELLHDGDSILIDGGSTTALVARNLHKKSGLTVITTSIHLLPFLIEVQDIKIFLAGGFYLREFEELVGEISMDSLGRFKPDHTIMGIDGISLENGITGTEPAVVSIKKKMISMSKDVIVVSDHTKFGKSCLFQVADLKEVQTIVTDDKVDKEEIAKISKLGVHTIVT
jgi:DeoR family transcriptional regulator of aga operon/DeoR family fructose operon transcriptional repressor